MKSIGDIFSCCNKDNYQPQVVVHLAKRKALSVGMRTARISRSSLTKTDQQLQHSTKHSQNCTPTHAVHTQKLMGQYPKKAKGISHTQSKSVEKIKQQPYFPHHSARKNHHVFNNQEIMDFIRDQRKNNKILMEHQHIGLQTIRMNQSPEVGKVATPRLLAERRVRKIRQQQGRSALVDNQSNNKNVMNTRSPFIVSVLQPIEQRLSLLSCSQTQVHDLNGFASRSIFLQPGDQKQHYLQASPLTQKFTSCIFNRSDLQGSDLKMVRSENIRYIDQKICGDRQKLIGNKIRIDIQIYEGELGILRQEEKYLEEELVFMRQTQKEKIEQLQKEKEQLIASLELIMKKRGDRMTKICGNGDGIQYLGRQRMEGV